jgi:nicotinamide mononucleotide (NMN) deamidase PncC
VWFALATASGVRSFEQRFPPVDRASIRRYAAHVALNLVRLHAR